MLSGRLILLHQFLPLVSFRVSQNPATLHATGKLYHCTNTYSNLSIYVPSLYPLHRTIFSLSTSRNDLDGIKQTKPRGPVTDWLTDMLDKKMKRSPEFGWSDAIQALVQIDCGALAESIQGEHCSQGEEKGHELFHSAERLLHIWVQ